MFDIIKRAVFLVLRFLGMREETNECPSAHRKRTKHVVEGGFKDLRSLLRGLDDTFDKLSRLSSRGSLPKMLKRHGPFIVSKDWGDDGAIEAGTLMGFKTYGLPNMLFCNIPWKKDSNDDHYQYFSWALKTEKVPYIQKKPGFTYYEYGAFFPKSSLGSEFGISTFVGVCKATGEVVPIPTYWEKPNQVFVNGQRPKTVRVPCYEYQVIRDKPCEDKKKAIIQDFCMLYSLVMRREFGANIVVTKNGYKATFIVPENEWKYFFRERVDTTTKTGRKIPVFHAVIAHERHLATGKVSAIKTHYRGSRFFVWNGYEVSIVIPEKHGRSQASFDIESVSEDSAKGSVKMIDAGEIDLGSVFGHHHAA